MTCKRLTVVLILVASVLLICSATASSSTITVFVDDQQVEYGDVEPAMSGGRLLVPLRATFEALDAAVVWNPVDASVVATRNKTIVQMRVGNLEAIVNGVTSPLDVPPVLIEGRVMIPLRFVAEAFGDNVVYNGSAGVVQITTSSVKDPVSVAEEGLKSVVLIECTDFQTVISGSGVVVGKGLIVTNYHVIEGAAWGRVVTADGMEYEIIGVTAADPERDLAVIKIDADLTAARLGDSDQVKIGESVVAIGSPYGLHNTVSTGIISGLRSFDGYSYIQMSAPIAAGSSGGGLFNMKGEVIGITVARISGDGELNFAIPVNEARELLAVQSEPVSFADLWTAGLDLAVAEKWLRDLGGLQLGEFAVQFEDVSVWVEDGAILFCLMTDYENGLVYSEMYDAGYRHGITKFMREILAVFEYLFPDYTIFGGITTIKYTSYYPHWASSESIWLDEDTGMWGSITVLATVHNFSGTAHVSTYNW